MSSVSSVFRQLVLLGAATEEGFGYAHEVAELRELLEMPPLRRVRPNADHVADELRELQHEHRASQRALDRVRYLSVSTVIPNTFRTMHRVSFETFEKIVKLMDTYGARNTLVRKGRPREADTQERLRVLLLTLGGHVGCTRAFEDRGFAKSTAADYLNSAMDDLIAITTSPETPFQWKTSHESDREALAKCFMAYIARIRGRRLRGECRRHPWLERDVVALAGVLGAVDGTLIRITRPEAPEFDEQAYVDRYGNHSIKVREDLSPISLSALSHTVSPCACVCACAYYDACGDRVAVGRLCSVAF